VTDRRHLALVGPTAAGKSAVAVAVAHGLGDVEIISVDSMLVYRGMDIGTAKPTPAEQGGVPHHLIDICDPAEDWSVARFVAAARPVIDAIEGRGHRALFVGGTGLYARAVCDGLDLPGAAPEVRAELEAEASTPDGLARLRDELEHRDPVAAGRIEAGNRRRLVRALEVVRSTGRPFSSFGPGLDVYPPARVRLAGLWLPRALTSQRIRERFARMMNEGLLDEVRTLAARPTGLGRTAREAIGYRELLAALAGERASIDDAIAAAVRRTVAFARRQRMWFRRDPRITWLGSDGNPGEPTGALLALWR
jgi:tRNA dimethylallyltransferase